MLTDIYIEALLVDEELADKVWDAWDKGEVDDQVAGLEWWLIAFRPLHTRIRLLSQYDAKGLLATRTFVQARICDNDVLGNARIRSNF